MAIHSEWHRWDGRHRPVNGETGGCRWQYIVGGTIGVGGSTRSHIFFMSISVSSTSSSTISSGRIFIG